MSTHRRLTIGAIVAAIVILVGIGVFVAHDMNAPVQEVKIYELPDTSDSPPAVAQLGPGKTKHVVFDQRGRASDTIIEQYSVESDQGYEDTAALSEIEPCCPDEEAPVPIGDINFGQDINLDRNPVPPEVIADSRRHSEWFRAFDRHHKKRVALKEEQDKLEEDFNSLRFSSDIDQVLRDIADPSYFDKLDAVWAKMEALQNKADILEKEYPVFPSD